MSDTQVTKRQLLVVLVVIYAGMGFLNGMLDPATRIYGYCQIASGLTTSLVALCWIVADSEERRYKTSKTLRIMVFLLSILAIPYYFLRTRGLRGFRSIAKTAGLFLVLILVEQVASIITWTIRTR